MIAPGAMDDPFMLELFRSELVTHSRTLSLCAPDLAGKAGPELAEAAAGAIRAAHAVKGAAHIVSAPVPAALAEAMESALSRLAREGRPASQVVLAALGEAAAVLARLGDLAVEALAAGAEAAAGEAEAVVAALRQAAISGQTEAGASFEQSGKAAGSAQAPVERPDGPEPAAVALKTPGPDASPPVSSDQDAPAEAGTEADAEDSHGPSPGGAAMDPLMLELFASELARGARDLAAGLPDLETGAPEAAASLARAAQVVRSAANIVGLSALAVLARSMENCLSVLAGEGAPGPDALDALAAGVEVFSRLAARTPGDIPGALAVLADGPADLAAALDRLAAAPGAATPAPITPEPVAEAAPKDREAAPAHAPVAAKAPGPTAGDGGELADLSMLDLFRMELENNAGVLEAGLVALEEDQQPESVEPLMRAAHSIKGAARIVGLPAAVELAHAMEDLLEGCRKSALRLAAGHIDLLLAGNDVFSALSRLSPEAIPAALAEGAADLAALCAALKGGQAGQAPARPPGRKIATASETAREPASGPAAASPPETAAKAVVQAPPAATAAPTEETGPSGGQAPEAGAATRRDKAGEGVVRVTAENLNRLMGLAGECLVEARSLESFGADFARLKAGHSLLAGHLNALRQAVALGAVPGAGPAAMGREAGVGRAAGGGACVLKLGEALAALGGLREDLGRAMERHDMFSRRLEALADRLYNEVIDSRMRPFSDGLRGFSRMVRDLARDLDKRARLTIAGEDVRVDREILERLEAPLTHLVRNAVDHGLERPEERCRDGKPETGTVSLSARHFAGMLEIVAADDGRGLDPERIRAKVVERGLAPPEMAASLSELELMDFLFLPGFTTAGKVTEISGRGVGLDVVHAMVREVGGRVRAASTPGQGMRFILRLPLTLSVMRALVVEIGGEPYAVPLTRIDRVLTPEPEDLRSLEGRQYLVHEEENVGLAPAWQVLGAPAPEKTRERLPVIVVSDRLNRYGLVVESFLYERDLVVKPLDRRLGKVPCVSAASILEDGSPTLILDVDDMVRAVDKLLTRGGLDRADRAGEEAAGARRAGRVLVVDDSLTVREMERRLLSNKGYLTETAVDGMDGLNALLAGDFDLVITDVDMPRLNGVELVRRMKADPRLADIPVMIVSYKDREEDRMAGLSAGADYYLTKSSFQDEGLLRAVADLIGEPESRGRPGAPAGPTGKGGA